jgi:hypothetical protein
LAASCVIFSPTIEPSNLIPCYVDVASMASRTLDELALDLKQRRLAGDLPPALLLGAGASVEAGIGAMPELYKLAGVADFKQFSDYIANRTEAERFRFLMSFLQTLRPVTAHSRHSARKVFSI